MKKLSGEIEEIITFTLPNADERSLVKIRKTAPLNKKYPRISLGKVILYDIYDDNLYKEINYFENRFEKEENLEKREKIFMEGVNEISKKLPYIPLEHHSLYILINRALEE